MSTQYGDKIVTKNAFEGDFDSLEEVDASEVDAMLEKKSVNMKDVSDVFRNVVGDVLTIIDAVIADKEQKKATKDLVKHSIYEGLDDLHALSEA